MSHQPVRKRRRLSPPKVTALPPPSPPASPSDSDAATGGLEDSFVRRAAKWDLEQDYEKRPRKQKEKENLRLPIKTAEGRIKQVEAPVPVIEDESDADQSQDESGPGDSGQQEDATEPKLSPREQVLQAKEELAKIAGLINEDPEAHIGSLKSLNEITASENPNVTILGLVTQMTVYKDIIPGYRIRPLSEEEMKEKISKDIRKLRNFEQSIVGNYQRYVRELSRLAGLSKNSTTPEAAKLSSVAMTCAAGLLTAVPHFNFRTDLLRILGERLSSREQDQDFKAAIDAIQKLFAEDDEGNSSLEAVSILSKMIRAKNYRVHEEVLNLFLHLRLLAEFSQKASATKVDAKDGISEAQNSKQGKQKREHRSKKERKRARETKAIEKEMKEADAIVSHEQKDKNQAETLKLVFGIYFRILKARTPHLMGPVLEGLVKYAHLINQEFFGDLIESLKELIEEQGNNSQQDETTELAGASSTEETNSAHRNITRESLLCCITAFALLEGQDAAAAASTLHLDLSFFITHLYRTLYSAATNADLELSAKSLHLPDPDSTEQMKSKKTKVDVQTTIVLLLRSLQSTLLPPANPHAVPPLRIAAFTKQILTSSLNMPEKSCTAMQGLIHQVVKIHKRKIAALWNTEERRGDGVFDPLRSTVEGSNPFATTIWEGELLRLHFAPGVRDAWLGIEKLAA